MIITVKFSFAFTYHPKQGRMITPEIQMTFSNHCL